MALNMNFSMSIKEPGTPYQSTADGGATGSEVSNSIENSPSISSPYTSKKKPSSKQRATPERLNALAASTQQLHDKIASDIM